jgi:hypothetical protein
VRALEEIRGGASCIINPPARPTQKCTFGAYATFEPLFLKAQENGLEFAIRTGEDTQNPITGNFLYGRSKLQGPDFKWNWGWRVTLGHNLAHDSWESYITWTYFHTHAHSHMRPQAEQLLSPTFISEGAGTTGLSPAAFNQGMIVDKAKTHWSLHYNGLNFETARAFFVSSWLALKPHGGLTTVWIHQRNTAEYLQYQIAMITPYVTDASVSMRNNFWGIGLRAGIESQWGIRCGWSLFGDASASILYGYFNLDHQESDILSSGDAVDPIFDVSNNYQMGRLITDFIAGIRYDYLFCERYHIGLQLGWEHHLFLGQNQFMKFIGHTSPGIVLANQGDLYIQGLSAQLRVDF